MTFEASSYLTTPQNDFGLPALDAGFYLLQVDADALTTTEIITATYGLNGAAATTAMTDGTGIFNNTNSDCYFGATNQGVSGKRIQIKYTLARGDTTTTRPMMLSAELSYRKRPVIKEDFTFLVDLGEGAKTAVGAASTAAMKTTLKTALDSLTKVNFSYEGLTATLVVVEDMGYTEKLPRELAELARTFKGDVCAVRVSELI